VVVWHVLNDQSEYRELGHDYFTNPGSAGELSPAHSPLSFISGLA
jgi:hypothetical protein